MKDGSGRGSKETIFLYPSSEGGESGREHKGGRGKVRLTEISKEDHGRLGLSKRLFLNLDVLDPLTDGRTDEQRALGARDNALVVVVRADCVD